MPRIAVEKGLRSNPFYFATVVREASLSRPPIAPRLGFVSPFLVRVGSYGTNRLFSRQIANKGIEERLRGPVWCRPNRLLWIEPLTSNRTSLEPIKKAPAGPYYLTQRRIDSENNGLFSSPLRGSFAVQFALSPK